jgi:2Fe-2S ferredoxin
MKVKFMPIDVELEIQPDQSIMNLAHENDIHISSVCNGMPSCAECRIRIVEGEHNLVPPGAKELGLIGTGHFIDQRRLSCQCLCFGDVTVDLSEQMEKASEAKVNKKFLKRAQIENPEDSHSQGGILIEQDEDFNKVNVNSDNIETRGDSSLSTAANSEKKAAKEGGRSRGDKPKRSRNRGNRNRRRRPNTGRGEKSSSQGGGSGDKS